MKTMQANPRHRSAVLGAFCCGMLCWLSAWPASARAEDEPPIYTLDSFDLVVLKRSAGGDKMRVIPLDFPNRRVPDPFPGGKLTVKPLNNPAIELEVAWSDVARIDLFEQLILKEGSELVSKKEFDKAFGYFQRLHSSYANTPGLAEATARYLQQDALRTFRNKEYDRALAMLASLYEEQPNFRGLDKAIDGVAGQIIESYVEKRNLRAARGVLDYVDREFGSLDLKVVELWRGRFQRAADSQVAKGAELFRKKDFRGARTAALEAKSVWPNHQRAEQLLKLIQRENPTMIVGVRTRAAAPLNPRLDSPASLRIGFLAAPTLTRITDYSPEGGIYASPIGAVGLDASGAELSLTVLDYPEGSPAALDAPAAVARWLLRAGDPEDAMYSPALAQVIGEVLTPEPDLLVVGMSRAHVRPEALLQEVLIDEIGLPAPVGAYEVALSDEQTLALNATSDQSAVASLEERLYTSDDESIAALVQGDIDVLSRLPPWLVSTLKSNPDIVVGQYRLPTVHVLIPTKKNKLLDQREFRRALCYGINRERVLKELILANTQLPGYQVISGPFPAGVSLSDGVRYAYNDGVRPRPYEPRLAALLAGLAWTNLQKRENGKDDPADAPIPTLKLAHSSDPIARTSCQAIQLQLKPLGIPIELVELPPEELYDPEGDFDLRYAELCCWEPIVDAMRLLGPDGIAGRCTDPMYASLRQLDQARNWSEALQTLREIHQLAAGDLPVIPLWQTANYYAHRSELGGLPPTIIHLYQSIVDWRKNNQTVSP